MSDDDRDIEGRLRADLDQLADLLLDEPDPASGPRSEADPGSVSTRRRQRFALVGVGAAAAVLAIAGIVAAVVNDRYTDGFETVGPADTVGENAPVPDGHTATALPGVSAAPPPPLSLRSGVATAWTGEEVVVWGGEAGDFGSGGGPLSDGAAYDPAAATWRPMAPSPLPDSTDRSIAAATDAGVVVARGTAVALWDPASDTWQRLPDAPAPVSDLVGAGEFVLSASAGAMFNFGTGDWETLPPAPVTVAREAAAWTGDELVVVGDVGPAGPAAAFVLDVESRTWREAGSPPDWLSTDVGVTWDGERVVVADVYMNAAAYVPASDRWEDLPQVPAHFSAWGASARTSTAGAVVPMVNTLVVLGTDGWTPLPTPEPCCLSFHDAPVEPDAPLAVWFVAEVAEDGESNRLLFLDVEELMASGQRQVGVATVSLPPDATQVASTERNRTAVDPRDPVTLGINVNGRACAITSTYLGIEDESGLPVDEPIQALNGQATWSRNEAATRWQIAVDQSDLVGVTCENAADARVLVQRITL